MMMNDDIPTHSAEIASSKVTSSNCRLSHRHSSQSYHNISSLKQTPGQTQTTDNKIDTGSIGSRRIESGGCGQRCACARCSSSFVVAWPLRSSIIIIIIIIVNVRNSKQNDRVQTRSTLAAAPIVRAESSALAAADDDDGCALPRRAFSPSPRCCSSSSPVAFRSFFVKVRRPIANRQIVINFLSLSLSFILQKS